MTPPRQNQSALNRLPANWALLHDVLTGLRASPKRLSSTYLYDERGSHLFDEICELPEYYVTRTETRILETHARDIAAHIGEGAMLVELGSGASTKTRLLLDQLPDLSAYVPVDISRSHLQAAAKSIAGRYPRLEVLPVCADFTQPCALPTPRSGFSRVVVFFPGSTIGNFDPAAATELLRAARQIAGSTGGLVIGYDLVKDPAVLRAAYNDRAGITAAFNLNVLHRLNRELGADFAPDAFRHEAVWMPEESRIEMHLVSLRQQTIHLSGEAVDFSAAERLVTEHCHKYTPQSFAALADASGWQGERTWTDPQTYFNVQYLR